MTDFSDCIDYVDRVKVEFHERFRFLLQKNSEMETRIIELEDIILDLKCLLRREKRQTKDL